MALNIAMPLSGVSDFLEGFGLLSPISPISVDCREHLKLLVSPIDSESSGISSLDSEESKEKKTPIKIEEDCKIFYNGKNILDLVSTLTDNKRWNIKYSELPENNFQMFLANRSQYHRLGTNGHIQEYSLNKCQCCDFQYPVNNYRFNMQGAVVAASSNNHNNINNHNNANTISSSLSSSSFSTYNPIIGQKTNNNNNSNNNIAKIDKNMNMNMINQYFNNINNTNTINNNNNNNNNNINNIRLYRQF